MSRSAPGGTAMLGPALVQPSVLIVGNFLSAAGASRGVCEDLRIRLGNAGWRVTVASKERGRILRLTDMLFTVWSRRHEYAVSQVDVFSGPAFVWAFAVTSLLGLLGKPRILTLHGGKLPEFSRRWPRLVRRMLTSAEVVTVPSAYLLREMKSYRADLVMLPNPLDVSAYPFAVRDGARPWLVWLRAFHDIYNPALAPAVVAQLVSDYPDVRLTMIGPDRRDGSLQATLQEAKRLGVSDRVQIIGGIAKSNVGGALSGADIFINTTNVDNTPVSVLEAMACGLCVVSTNVGGLPDLVSDGWDGILVPPRNPEAMASGIRRILGSRELAAHLSVNGRRKADQFDWSVLLPRWERLLQAARGGGR